MANVINFDLPKDEIIFSDAVRLLIYVPCDVWDTMADTSTIRNDEMENFVKSSKITNPGGELEYLKIFDGVIGIKIAHPSDKDEGFAGYFDLTITLKNRNTFNYPLVSVYMVFPYSHPERYSDD